MTMDKKDSKLTAAQIEYINRKNNLLNLFQEQVLTSDVLQVSYKKDILENKCNYEKIVGFLFEGIGEIMEIENLTIAVDSLGNNRDILLFDLDQSLSKRYRMFLSHDEITLSEGHLEKPYRNLCDAIEDIC